ncbi:hypothetical protein GOP47_0009591 [Adiantum capillus-veneris]|uniref:Uncharacterized protein n=1 Tax=Adiantum capillus-veneris TaxID=13818 RepID=A0A9D4UXA6_ADICA|nr:hypothetical protein GOP47_0009591 [Adiantum capillus-veneris]
MDLQVDKTPLFNPHDSPKLREGERVEVRQKDVGLRGSWHPGTIVGLKAGRRLVEYDELLTDDGLRKLRESIPCPKLSDMPGICPPPKCHPLAVTPTSSPSKRRGLLRPSPPVRTEPSPLTWKGGLFVDVFYQDAWWEAVLLNDVTSLDGGTVVDVLFPDEGDLARVYVKDMRISQCWDEVSGDWSIKGSLDLSRFLRRRGIGKKEVSLTADSDCRTSEVCNSFIPNEEKLHKNRWIKTCSSLHSISKVPSSCETVGNKSSEELSPSKCHEQVIPIRSSTEESAVQPIMPSRDGSLIFDLPESEHQLEILTSIDRSKKLSCEGTKHPELRHGGTLFGNDIETVDSGEKLHDGDDVAECKRSPSCEDFEEFGLGRETVGKDSIEGGIFFKRRKIGEAPFGSYVSEVKLSDSQSFSPSFLPDHEVGTLKPVHEEWSSGRGECGTPHWGAVHRGGLLHLEDSSKRNSTVVVKEPEMGLSIGSDYSNPLKKQVSSPPATCMLDRSKRPKVESKLLQKRPVCKVFLLALEAPVRKTREEYDQIMLAGKAALGEGVSSGRYRRKKVFAQGLEDGGNKITSAGHRMFKGGVSEMVTRPKNRFGKVLPVCDQNSRENYGKSTTSEISKLGGVILENVLRPRRKAPAQNPSKGHQIILAGKAALEHAAVEKSVQIMKRAGEILRSPGRTEKRVDKDTLRSFRDHLVRQKQAKSLKRKASDISLALEAGSKDVKLLKASKSDREPEQSESATTLPLSNFEDSITMKRMAHKRRRVPIVSSSPIVSSPAEPASAACDGSNLVKRKAPKVSCILENGDRSVDKLPTVPKADQAEAASVSHLSSFKVRKLKKTDDRSLKNLAREIGIKAVLEAGFTIEYRPRRGHLSSDAVYTSRKGHSYWSLPKAWQALGNEKKKVRVKVEKSVIQQVLSKIDQDETLRSAFEKLDRFSGTCLEEVKKQANMTYAELTDLLIEDLRVLRKHVWKPKGNKKKAYIKGKQEKQKSGKKSSSNGDLTTPLHASGSLLVKKRGRKRKQEVQTVSGKVDCSASTSKVYSRLKHVQGNALRKLGKNRSNLMEATSKILNRFHTSVGSRKAAFKAGSSMIYMASQKQRNNLKGSLKNRGIEEVKKESFKSEGKELKPRSGLRLEVRPSSSCMDDSSEEFSCQSKRTVLSWLLTRGAVLETERVSCVDQVSNEVLKEGISTREGILCRCCKGVYTVRGFEEHGGNQRERPNCYLLFASGKTFSDYQLEAWDMEMDLRRTENYKGVSASDTNDDTCLVCGDGGVLLCCDFCPSTFHASCLQLDNVPEGNWYCPKCCCGVCKGKYNTEDEAVCSQCEHKYHIACLQGGHTILRELFFCRESCKKIYSGLKSLNGVTHSLDKGFSWSLLHCIEEPQPEDSKIVAEINSKLAVALLVLKECFNPMVDPRTNIDMITHAAYNRRSQFSRLNYVGFYTVVLERDDEIISVASIRIHGARVAEMPLIGTRHKYRRQGMCRLLVGAIEKLLMSLEVATFILPAIQELYATWTQAFGFRPLYSPLSLEIKDLSMMMFPGTDLLQKSLQGDTAVGGLILLRNVSLAACAAELSIIGQ